MSGVGSLSGSAGFWGAVRVGGGVCIRLFGLVVLRDCGGSRGGSEVAEDVDAIDSGDRIENADEEVGAHRVPISDGRIDLVMTEHEDSDMGVWGALIDSQFSLRFKVRLVGTFRRGGIARFFHVWREMNLKILVLASRLRRG